VKGKRILWVDDEIELLNSHIIFLRGKGYEVEGVSSGEQAIEAVEKDRYDLVLLDETMPGMSGLETLQQLKRIDSNIPVIMITKNEAEDLMDQAIGMKIDNYLLKPINPVQVYSAVKGIIESQKIQESAFGKDYLSVYNRISQRLMTPLDWKDWADIHMELSHWDVEFDRFPDTGLEQTHDDLRKKCNIDFGRYVGAEYVEWVNSDKRPSLSVDVFKRFIFPHLFSHKKVYFIVIDCMRFDQWLTIQDLLAPLYRIETDYCFSILPSATPYARNGIFSGLFPLEIQKRYHEKWLERAKDEFSKNRFEAEFMADLLKRNGFERLTSKYVKIYEIGEANEVRRQVGAYKSIEFVTLVFNFLDILAHGRSQSDILQEIAPDESAFRSLMRSWFTHSALYDILQQIAQHNAVIVITTDHGSILGKRASLVHGNRETSTNLRYKFGENINGDPKQTVLIKNPTDYMLPAESPSKNYIIAKENYYFVYPTRFHEYEKQYHGTFQHGGISLEEMIIPCVTLYPR